MGRIALAASWLATTIGAAALGWLSTSYLDRGRPEVTISDVRPSPVKDEKARLDDGSARFIESSFLEELDSSVWLESIDPQNDSIADMVDTVNKDAKDASDLVDTMSEFRAEYPDLVSLAESMPGPENARIFFGKWRKVGNYIYDALTGDIKRGTFSPPALQTYNRTPYLLSFDRSINGKKYACVHETGGLYDSCINVTSDEVSEDTLREVSLALANFDQPTLRRYLDDVKQDADHVKEIEKTKQDLAVYSDGFSRWSVSALVSNAGSRPVSIMPEASFYVNTQNASGFDSNLSIPMVVRTKDGTSEPITVNGGETKLLTLASRTLVVGHEKWRELTDLFRSGSRNCFVALRVEGDPWLENDVIKSPVRAFGVPAGGEIVDAEEVRKLFVAGR